MCKLLYLLLILLLAALPCGAAASTIRLSGYPPTYRLEATGFNQVAAIDVTIRYDANALSVEAFENGPLLQGAMSASNLNRPGTVRLGVVTTNLINGSGLLGTLKVKQTGTAASAPTLIVSLRDANGQTLPVSIENSLGSTLTVSPFTETATPSFPPSPAASVPAAPLTTTSRSHGSSISSGTVSGSPFPQETPSLGRSEPIPPHERNPLASSPPPAPPQRDETTAPKISLTTTIAKAESDIDSPFQRFSRGIATIKSQGDLARLLQHPKGISQTPAYALSDGKTPVTLKIAGSRQSPTLAAQGAKLLDSGQGEDKILYVDLLPEVRARRVSLVIVDEVMRTIDLVVAVPITLNPKRSDEDYLKNWQDLDGDGVITYEEAWSVAINLLAQREREVKRRGKQAAR